MANRHYIFFSLVLVALSAVAQTLQVNAAPLEKVAATEELAAQIEIDAAHALTHQTVSILEAEMTVSIPSADPLFDETVTEEDKFVLAARADGKGLWVSDATAWKALDVAFAEGVAVPVRIEARLQDEETAHYRVKVGEAVCEVTRPSKNGDVFKALQLLGFGAMERVQLKQLTLEQLPVSPSGTQEAAKVDAYVAWAADEDNTVVTADYAEDAFAMNVKQGKPRLEIVDIDMEQCMITIKASVEGQAEEVALTRINGVLSMLAYTKFSNEARVYKVAIDAGVGDTVCVPFPDDAQFAQASISLYPAKTPVNEDGPLLGVPPADVN